MAPHNRIISRTAFEVLEMARLDAVMYRNPYITPEHVLFQMEGAGVLKEAMEKASMKPTFFRESLGLFISYLSTTDPAEDYDVKLSKPLREALKDAIDAAGCDGGQPVTIFHLLWGISGLDNSLAGYLLRQHPEVLDGFGVSSERSQFS